MSLQHQKIHSKYIVIEVVYTTLDNTTVFLGYIYDALDKLLPDQFRKTIN